jgi:hypothetical protein
MGHRVSTGEEETAGRRITSASHAHRWTIDGGKQHGGTGWGGGGSVVQLGRRPKRIGLEWAEVGPRAGPAARLFEETTWAIKVNQAELTIGCGKLFSQFSNTDLGFKIKDFKFQTKIELGPN